MKKIRISGNTFKSEEIVRHLREADVMPSQGGTFADGICKIGVNVKRVHRTWRREGLKVPMKQAKR